MKGNNVVISTRIRLARNLKDYPFPGRLDENGKNKVVATIKSIGFNATYIDMQNLKKEQALSLVERHLISPEFAQSFAGKGLLLNENDKTQTISIMINEEDHVRIQVIAKGLELEKAFAAATELDDKLCGAVDVAYNEKFGHLTQCPTNLGTGMRASVMLHLPALQKSGAINSLSQNLSKLGLTIRGLYGEGTKPKGAIYQLSNQITLGISEETAIANLKNIATQIAAQEEAMRQNLLQSPDIQDALSRSVGMLKYCRVINHAEAVELLSNLRFALAVEMIDGINIADIDALMEKIQPANILLGGGVATPEERDKKRAEIIHEALRGL